MSATRTIEKLRAEGASKDQLITGLCTALDAAYAVLEDFNKATVRKNDQYMPGMDTADRQNKVDTSQPFGPVGEKLKSGNLDIEGALNAMIASGIITTKQLEAFFASHGIEVGSMDTHSGSTAGAPSYAKSGTLADAVEKTLRTGHS